VTKRLGTHPDRQAGGELAFRSVYCVAVRGHGISLKLLAVLPVSGSKKDVLWEITVERVDDDRWRIRQIGKSTR
jgi:hypothetical protein